MEWIEVKITTTAEGIEPLTGLLYDLGISGIIISDKDDFAQFLENNRKYWDYVDEELEKLKEAESSITLYLSDDAVGAETLVAVRNMAETLKKGDVSGEYGAVCYAVADLQNGSVTILDIPNEE